MKFKKNFLYFINNLREKHRVSVRNQHTDSEVWYVHLSPLNVVSGFVALIMVLFIIIVTTVAYTSILDFIPGYPGNKSRELLVNNIIRLDSLEQEIRNMRVYSDNISLIMEGKNPVTSTDAGKNDSLAKGGADAVSRIIEDSLLRYQMEMSGGMYSLNDPSATRKNLRNAMELFTPVRGVVSQKFSPVDGRYGVVLATTDNQQVMSVMDGTVLSSEWNPQQGYVLYVQHANNIISIYRHLVSVLKKVGDRVQSGEIVGYTGGDSRESISKNVFQFELWHNGTPVDPQGYIVF